MIVNVNNDTAPWNWLWGVLSFDILITPYVLIAAYYAGAVGMPVLLVWLMPRLSRRLGGKLLSGMAWRWRALGPRRWWILLAGLALFLMMELMWRVCFEFLIAYFQIRDALVARPSG